MLMSPSKYTVLVEMEPKKGNEATAQPVAGQAKTPSQNQTIASPPKNNVIDETHVVFVQISFLFTNPKRERVLRIINHGIKVSSNLGEIYENCDYVAIGNMITRKSVPLFYDGRYSLIDINNSLTQQAKKLYMYSNQVLKQEGKESPLVMLPMLTLGILKHPIFNMHTLISRQQLQRAVVGRRPEKHYEDHGSSHELRRALFPDHAKPLQPEGSQR